MSAAEGPAAFGRVDPDGTVYVRVGQDERRVGQMPGATAEEALAFYVRRFEALETEVNLLAERVGRQAVSPDEARRSINQLKSSLAEANAVGDLQGLISRLDALLETVAAASQERKAERAARLEEARAAKEAMVSEAEQLATSNDWRGGVARFRVLLDQWKALPRIDRATDDELWHRFSTARTTYTRRRKAQFAEQSQLHEGARHAKEQILVEARALADSTDWGQTSAAFRELMNRWKAAGSASRDVDDQLWSEFRALQDHFFAARNAHQDRQDAEFRANQDAKQALLDEAEKTILPIKDVAAARAAYRDFLGKFNALGKVPRDAIRPLDSRVRALEQAIKKAEDAEWRRTDPSARERAQEAVNMFSAQIEKLTKQADAAERSGDTRRSAKLRESIATYTTWLDQARATLAEFSA